MAIRLDVGREGLSVETVARKLNVSVQTVQIMCRNRRIIGASKHPLTKRWWIYPPGILVGSKDFF